MKLMAGKSVLIALVLACTLLVLSTGSMACSIAPASAEKDQVTMDILNSAMNYIKAHHTDAAPYINDNISFSVELGGKRQVGYTGITYMGGGWTVSIGHAITPETVYDIRAVYQSGKMAWTGLSKNGQITEVSYAVNEK